VFLLIGTVFAQNQSGTKAAESNAIVDAQVSPNGRVQITLRSGKHIEPLPGTAQTDCSDIKIAPEGKAAGWLVAYGSYGASYPIPTRLIVYRPGRPIRRFGNGLMLIEWAFADGVKHVQFSSSTVHGSNTVEKQLWDIETGRLLKKWTEEQ
jgi:hypothetical protein